MNEMESGAAGERPWDRATRTASDVGQDLAGRAAELGRRIRESGVQERVVATIDQRPWTVLAVALGVGVAIAVAGSGGRSASRVRTVARSPEDGDDYLAEYEDALVAGSPRWAARGREAVRRPASRPGTSADTGAAGPESDWRPSDAELAGDHGGLAELGRGFPVNEGAMESHVSRDSWRTGMIE